MKSIQKKSLGLAEGMLVGPSMPDYEGGMRQANWSKVKQFIEENKEKLSSTEVGLAEDWDCTSGEVWNTESGYIPQEDTYVYASSNWATPSMCLFFKNGEEQTIECWELGSNAHDYFPE